MHVDQPDLPANLQAETAILGAILNDNNTMIEVAATLKEQDFSLDSHQRIYRAIADMVEAGQSADLVTVMDEMTKRRQLDTIGGASYLAFLTEGIPHNLNVTGYCDMVKDRAVLRAAMNIANEIMASAVDLSESGIELACRGTASFDALMESGSADKTEKTSVLQGAAEFIEEFAHRASLDHDDTMSYGAFDRFDVLTGGMFPGEVTVVGGASGVGKSSLMIQALVAAGRAGISSVCYSLEMTRTQLIGRMASIVSGIPYRYVRFPRTANLGQRDAIKRAALAIAEWPMDVFDRAGMNLREIVASMKFHIARKGVKLVAADYIQRISVPEQRDVRLQVSEAAKHLAMAVKGTPAHLLLLSQLTRKPDDSLPRMKDLRESGQIENEAHVIALLWRRYDEATGDYGEESKIIIPKSRFGYTGTLDAGFNRDYATYEDVAQ
jgi:replicative DNA helicase